MVGSSLRDVGPFQPEVAQMVYDFIAGRLAHRTVVDLEADDVLLATLPASTDTATPTRTAVALHLWF